MQGIRLDSPLEEDGFELPVRGRGEFGLSPLFSRPVAWTGRCGRSGVPRFRVFVRRVAEAVDGHPEPGVDCLAELMCH